MKRLTSKIKREVKTDNLLLVGIQRRGVYLAERVRRYLKNKKKIPLAILDITLYRDDLSTVSSQPIVRETKIPFNLEGKDILLIDDVLYTGRTVRAAIDELIDFGRPNSIKLMVLIDRGHRELPIQPDFVGKTISTKKGEMVEVRLREIDKKEEAVIVTQR